MESIEILSTFFFFFLIERTGNGIIKTAKGKGKKNQSRSPAESDLVSPRFLSFVRRKKLRGPRDPMPRISVLSISFHVSRVPWSLINFTEKGNGVQQFSRSRQISSSLGHRFDIEQILMRAIVLNFPSPPQKNRKKVLKR